MVKGVAILSDLRDYEGGNGSSGGSIGVVLKNSHVGMPCLF